MISAGKILPTKSEIESVLANLGVPLLSCWIEGVSLLCGLTLKTPLDMICWYPLVGSNEAKLLNNYGEPPFTMWSRKTADGLWLSVCSTDYPGQIYFWERGSFHIEADPELPWFSSILGMIEENACIYETVGEKAETQVWGMIEYKSISELEGVLGVVFVPEASDRARIYRCENGIAVIFSFNGNKDGLCAATLFGSTFFVDSALQCLSGTFTLSWRKDNPD